MTFTSPLLPHRSVRVRAQLVLTGLTWTRARPSEASAREHSRARAAALDSSRFVREMNAIMALLAAARSDSLVTRRCVYEVMEQALIEQWPPAVLLARVDAAKLLPRGISAQSTQRLQISLIKTYVQLDTSYRFILGRIAGADRATALQVGR